MWRENNRLTLGFYTGIGLYNATGKYVSRSVICKWFLTRHAFKGGLGALNQVPIDKFSPDNCLCLMEYVSIITQIDPMLGGPAHLFLSKYVFERESFFLLLFLRREEPRNPCTRSQFLATEFPPPPIPKYFGINHNPACGGFACRQSAHHVEFVMIADFWYSWFCHCSHKKRHYNNHAKSPCTCSACPSVPLQGCCINAIAMVE